MVQYCKVGGKTFTTADRHKGNGSVEFLPREGSEVWARGANIPITPNTWENLTNHEVAEVIDGERIIGHVAILVNPASTFGFPMETISAVGLGTAGWEGLGDH
ncbi:hypothetical protein PGT21_000468 [Puccinia graminis f. sp. tritici]|uniref:Uncharacterized protein n=1 Tax=Puccinia graminis f. sp. tritici TaxID=56615 RepID=A0A5B0Q172_PUCGR|nr:hypothetical protein PGT21_000468 [Puccinia graminis f. sp. tritici]